MKKQIQFILFSLLFLTVIAPLKSQSADDIKGIYLTGSGSAQVRIFKSTQGKYYGKIEWLEEPNREDGSVKLDDKNPDESKRKEPLLGLLILKDFKYNEKSNEWEHGTIYDPKSGSTYKCVIWYEDGNMDVLHVKGYVGFSLLGKEEKWKRETEIRK